MTIRIWLLTCSECDGHPGLRKAVWVGIVPREVGRHDWVGTLPEPAGAWRIWSPAPRARARASVRARGRRRARACTRDREDQRPLVPCCFMYRATKVAIWAHAERSCSRPRTQMPNSFIRSFVQ
jgi:hypothetical protein